MKDYAFVVGFFSFTGNKEDIKVFIMDKSIRQIQ